jgi:hypothetical protein
MRIIAKARRQPLMRGVAALFPMPCVLSALSAAPVINEIMYRPGTGYPENTALEFIELYNPDEANSMDVAGWAITKGTTFTLPAGAAIPPNGYLVITANVAAFQAAHPGVTNLHGPWRAGSALADKGETITLSMPDPPAGAWTTVDSVKYADEGDWASRTWDTTNGFQWVTGANGAGKSLERRNPKLASDHGQNWGDSTVVGGSPGAANSLLTANLAPVIRKVSHWPAVPKSTEAVTISCELNDELAASSLTATLWWRDATSASPAAFASQPMTGTDAGYFSTSLPARTNKSVIEFYLTATDGSLTRTWPAPTSVGQTANCLYQVDDEVIAGIHPAYRLIMTGAENSAYTTTASSSGRQFHLTFIASHGDQHTVRYRSSIRYRGNTSRNWAVRPARVSFPTDDLWNDVSDFAINSKYPYCQYLGMRCLQLAGLPACDATPVEVRRNGVEYTVTGTTGDFGKLVHIEELNGDFVDNHWPEAPGGNVYRAETMNGTQWVSTGAAPATPNALWNGWSKQNAHGVNDWSDVMNFSAVWQTTVASHFTGATAGNVASGIWNNVPFSDAEVATLATVCDMDQIARFFAVFTIIQNTEGDITSGTTDDYAGAWIENALGQRRLNLIPYDQDNTWGKGDSAGAYNASGLYNMTEQNAIFEPLLPLLGNSTTAGNAAFRAKYLTEIRRLYGGLFDADTSGNPNPPFHRFLDNHVGTWVDATTLTQLKTFATQRQAHILGLIGQPKIAPAPASVGTLTTPLLPVVRINEVMAANVTAHPIGTTYPDVIELHNSGATDLSVAGLSLTDDAASPRKYVIPEGVTIPAGGHLLVYADSATSQPGLHALFQLDALGESVKLYDTPANGGGLLDEVVFGPQPGDLTISRTAADPALWALTAPTLGAANGSALALGGIGNVRLNEWAGNTVYRLNKDFIELYNSAASPVPLGTVRLTDDLANYPLRKVFPPLSFIAANGFILFDEDELGYRLDAKFGFITLVGDNGELIDQVSIDSQFGDRSTGRTTDGAPAYSQFSVPTPGFSNGTTVPAHYANVFSFLRITEIMAKPTGGNNFEFIELQNTGTTALDLGGVRFSNGIDFTFASGTTLAAGGFIVVCKDRAAFLARHPGAASALAEGFFTGALDNSGENLRLSLPGTWPVHILNFDFDPDWFALTADSGYSLTTLNAATSLAADWGESFTWAASAVANGTPGSDGPPTITSATSAAAVLDDAFNYQITATRFPSGYAATDLPPGLGLNPASGLITGIPTVVGTFHSTLYATNAGGTSSVTVTFSVNSSGPLAAFTWDYLPASTPAGTPFAVQITARDAAGRVVTSFTGTATLSGSVSSGAVGSPIVITEVTDAAQDQFELQNITNAAVSTSGWYVKVSDSNNNTNINLVNAVQFALPASITAGGLVWGTEQSPPPVNATAFGAPINWSATGSPSKGWIMLFDGTNTLRDFVIWGWTAAQISTLNVTINGVNLTGGTIASGNHWSGNGITTPGTGIFSVIKRQGNSDTNTAANFTNTTTGANFFATNVGLTVPWITTTPVTLTPANAAFANGVFIGTATLSTVINGAILKATDPASGNLGHSAAIDITAALPDADGDGLPDPWESAHGITNAAADDDGDGFTNAQEYLAGTAPNSVDSRLSISSAELPDGGAHLTITWPAIAGKIYRIRQSGDLLDWSTTGGDVLAATTGMQARTISLAGQGQLFFRIEIVP